MTEVTARTLDGDELALGAGQVEGLGERLRGPLLTAADEGERVRSAFGDRYDRLVEVKNRWDPDNLFRMNQNVAPTV